MFLRHRVKVLPLTVSVVVGIILLVIPEEVKSEFQIKPTFGISSSYSDNIFNATKGRERGDISLSPSLELEMRNKFSPDFLLSVSGKFDGKRHITESAADNYTVRGEIQARGRITRNNPYRIMYRRSVLRRGNFMDWTGTPGPVRDVISFRLGQRLGRRLSLDFEYRRTGKDCQTAARREDELNAYSASLSLNFLPTVLCRLEFQIQDNESNISRHNYDNRLIGALLLLPLGEGTNLSNLVQYHMMEYPNVPVAGDIRKDRRIFLNLSINQEISKVVSMGLGYTFQNNDSNVVGAEHTSNILSGELKIGF